MISEYSYKSKSYPYFFKHVLLTPNNNYKNVFSTMHAAINATLRFKTNNLLASAAPECGVGSGQSNNVTERRSPSAGKYELLFCFATIAKERQSI